MSKGQWEEHKERLRKQGQIQGQEQAQGQV